MPPGPDSPPALVQASLPTPYADSGSSRSPSPPEYIPAPVQATNDYIPVPNYPLGMTHAQYSNATSTYQDQSHSALYAFENGSSQSQPAVVDNGVHSYGVQDQTFTYANSFGDQHITSSPIEHVQHIDTTTHNSSSPPPIQYSPVSSRHSLSHISNPQAYSHAAHSYPPASGPPSPTSARSVSSHASMASGPHTPTYTYQEEVKETTGYHPTDAGFEPITDTSCISAGYYNSQGDLVTNAYASHLTTETHPSYSSRYHSSPPILVPAQERVIHGDLQPHTHHAPTLSSPSTCMPISAASAQSPLSPYLHHPRPISGATPHYHHQLPHLSLHPADWGKPHAALPAIHN
jgi:zinc finger protein CreA/MIG